MRTATNLDQIVGDHAVSAHDQLEGGLGFADATLAEQENADPKDVHEHAVDAGRGRELAFDVGLDGLDDHRGAQRRSQQRHAQAIRGFKQLGGDVQSLGHHDARRLECHEGFDPVPRLLDREAGQVRQLRGAQDLHTFGLNLAHETGQGQAGFLHAVEGHAAAEPGLTCKQNEP